MRVRLTTEPDGSTALESPYNPTFVDGLKAAVYYDGRKWEPSRKLWIIRAVYADALMQFLHEAGATVQDDREEAQAVTYVPPMPEDLKTAMDSLFVAYTAPLCVCEASYRALAKYWHPDKGGNPEDFHRVNDAIDIVRKYLDPTPETRYDRNDDIPF